MLKIKLKYKLIKEYPGSPKLGTIIEKEVYKDNVVTADPSALYSIYPEFWEEIKDEYPKIIAFRTTMPNYSEKYTYTLGEDNLFDGWIPLEKMLHKGNCVDNKMIEIYQVAKSETESFTLLDKTNKGVIEKFKIGELFGSILAIINNIPYAITELEHYKEVFPRIYSFRSVKYNQLLYILMKDNRYYANVPEPTNYELDSMLYKGDCVGNGHFIIHQVQISENEILTIGDRVTYSDRMKEFWEDSPIFKVREFKLLSKEEIVIVPDFTDYREGQEFLLHQIKKLKKLFTTEDFIDIYEGDVYWYTMNLCTIHKCIAKINVGMTTGCFSTKEKAEEYLGYKKLF